MQRVAPTAHVTQFPSHAEYVPRHPQADAPHLRFATNQVALNAPPRLGGKEHLILAPLERPVDMLNTLTLPTHDSESNGMLPVSHATHRVPSAFAHVVACDGVRHTPCR